MNCPHCAQPIFRKSSDGGRLKARTRVLVLHRSGDAETNCPGCGEAVVLGRLEVKLRKAQPKLVIRTVAVR